VLLADDHAPFREGIAEIFAAEDDILVIGEAENGSEAIARCARTPSSRRPTYQRANSPDAYLGILTGT
jgi:CheY-like chemotaxis protein